MSILLSTVFPLALYGAGLPGPTAQAAPAPVAAKVIPAPAKPAAVIPAVVSPQSPPVQLIQVQGPAPTPAPAPQAAPALSNDAIVERVGKALTDVKTAQGRFNQIDAEGKLRTGVFYISRPGKVRFEYTTPEPMFIVSDGVTVQIEEPKRDSRDSMPLASSPLHLFLRPNVNLKGDVSGVKTGNGSYFVTLVDKSGEADGKMILEFRASDFELLGWRALDGNDKETRMTLSDTRKNVSLKPSLFIVKTDDEHR